MLNEQSNEQSELVAYAKSEQQRLTKGALRSLRLHKISVVAKNIAIFSFIFLAATVITVNVRALTPAPTELVSVSKPEDTNSEPSRSETVKSEFVQPLADEPQPSPSQATEPEPTDEIPLDIDLNPENKQGQSPYQDISKSQDATTGDTLEPLGEVAVYEPKKDLVDVLFSGWAIAIESAIFSASLLSFILLRKY